MEKLIIIKKELIDQWIENNSKLKDHDYFKGRTEMLKGLLEYSSEMEIDVDTEERIKRVFDNNIGINAELGYEAIKNEDVFNALRQMAIEQIAAEQAKKERWIPVSEKEPQNREKVLIKWIQDGREIKSCGSLVTDSQLGKYWQSGGATQMKVTHWRPFN